MRECCLETEEENLRECVGGEGLLHLETEEDNLRELVNNRCPKTEEDNLRQCVGEELLSGDRGGKTERVCW